MHPSPVVRFGVVPAAILLPLTVLRTWLEVAHPHAVATRFVSVFALAVLWILVSTVVLLRRGASFGAMFRTAAVFIAAHRIPIGASYALAWAYRWRTPDGAPTRYEAQVAGEMRMPADASGWRVFAFVTLFPIVVHIAFAVLVWFVAWAVAFRRSRPAIKAAAA